jgi:hypothetical protein
LASYVTVKRHLSLWFLKQYLILLVLLSQPIEKKHVSSFRHDWPERISKKTVPYPSRFSTPVTNLGGMSNTAAALRRADT